VVVLDYGRDVGGTAQFTVSHLSGTPVVRAAFSEALANLSPRGDGTITTDAGTGDPHRYDDFALSGAGTITSTSVQGGERYEALSLSRPGSVSMRSVAIHFDPYLGTPGSLRGWFLSSSDLLNRIWYGGVYTANLVQERRNTQSYPGEVNRDDLVLDGVRPSGMPRPPVRWGSGARSAGSLRLASRTAIRNADAVRERQMRNGERACINAFVANSHATMDASSTS